MTNANTQHVNAAANAQAVVTRNAVAGWQPVMFACLSKHPVPAPMSASINALGCQAGLSAGLKAGLLDSLGQTALKPAADAKRIHETGSTGHHAFTGTRRTGNRISESPVFYGS